MSKTETQTEAQCLADQLRALSFGGACILAAEELGRLDAEVRDLKMAVSHESLCVEAAKERIRQLDAENKVLRERLEIDLSRPLDGIEARDCTIKIQGERIAWLEAELAAMSTRVQELTEERLARMRLNDRMAVRIAELEGKAGRFQGVPLALIEAINTATGNNEWQGDHSPAELLESACRAIAGLVERKNARIHALEMQVLDLASENSIHKRAEVAKLEAELVAESARTAAENGGAA